MTPRVQLVKLHRKYRLGIGKTEDLDNSNREAIPAMETRKVEAREGDRRQKARQSVY
jgi:hypothetical protein